MKYLFSALFLILSASISAQTKTSASETTDLDSTILKPYCYVDPRIGSGGHGHVFVGASVPWGMVNVGPTELNVDWDWCSGYHVSSDSIVGFAQTHLSGTGCSDLGDVALMPCYGYMEIKGDKQKDGSTQWTAGGVPIRRALATPFSHEHEEVVPGYYSVMLDNGIRVELTATDRVALHKYTFARGSRTANIVLDLENGVGDVAGYTRIWPMDGNTLVGYRSSDGWTHHKVYFAICFDKPWEALLLDSIDNPYSQAIFSVGSGESIMARVAISPVSVMGALVNMQLEMPVPDFAKVMSKAVKTWNTELSRINATFRTEKEARVFYTALYHTMIAPQTWSDATGDFLGADYRYVPDGRRMHDNWRSPNFKNYTTWSLWDTYRALHPLATIIMPDKLRDWALTMINIWKDHGELPMWSLHSGETYCMVGEPGIPVLADMILKNTPGFDYEEAYQALKSSLAPSKEVKESTDLIIPDRGKTDLWHYGYLPFDGNEGEVVAKSLEYYLAAWSVAQVAGKLGHKEDSIKYADLSMNYKNLYDPKTKCMRAKNKAGKFRTVKDFNPSFQTSDYTEGNPWQYSWLVPHDIPGLIQTMGGKAACEARLDSLFSASSELNAEANPDISGLIGQYAHGNEPSHHIIYIYNYLGSPRKTQSLARQVLSTLYTDSIDGLCGNEDVGQMSAWYIMSALGLYQVEPCGGKYQLGSPIVENAVINVGNGKTFTVRTHGGSDQAIYVKKYVLNGKQIKGTTICHEDIVKGGVLDVYF